MDNLLPIGASAIVTVLLVGSLLSDFHHARDRDVTLDSVMRDDSQALIHDAPASQAAQLVLPPPPAIMPERNEKPSTVDIEVPDSRPVPTGVTHSQPDLQKPETAEATMPTPVVEVDGIPTSVNEPPEVAGLDVVPLAAPDRRPELERPIKTLPTPIDDADQSETKDFIEVIEFTTDAHTPTTDTYEKRRDPAQPATKVTTTATMRTGRVLLRILEQGAGPSVEIAWPNRQSERESLYRFFRGCLGMRVVLMSTNGKIFSEAGVAGQPWSLNLDRYSGFVRKPQGQLIGLERETVQLISNRHSVRGSPVRLFPRSVDASILGGLRNLIGEDYNQARTIHARYQQFEYGVMVAGINVDGSRVAGVIPIRAGKSACMKNS